MNARGIPPAAQQVFAELICLGGVPTLVPTLDRGTYPGQGWGYLPWLGGTYLVPG